MHMDTVGLSRGAADCSETNFTIISFGGGERLRAFIYQIWENDKWHELRGGSRKDERVFCVPGGALAVVQGKKLFLLLKDNSAGSTSVLSVSLPS